MKGKILSRAHKQKIHLQKKERKKSKQQSQLECLEVPEQRTKGIHKEITTVVTSKECNICHKNNDNLKETERSIKEWYKMTHEIKLL